MMEQGFYLLGWLLERAWPHSLLQGALETAWNWKLARDHVNPPRSSDVKPAVYDLISMLKPADPKKSKEIRYAGYSRGADPAFPISGSRLTMRRTDEYYPALSYRLYCSILG